MRHEARQSIFVLDIFETLGDHCPFSIIKASTVWLNFCELLLLAELFKHYIPQERVRIHVRRCQKSRSPVLLPVLQIFTRVITCRITMIFSGSQL